MNMRIYLKDKNFHKQIFEHNWGQIYMLKAKVKIISNK